jgi:hypothetical protein
MESPNEKSRAQVIIVIVKSNSMAVKYFHFHSKFQNCPPRPPIQLNYELEKGHLKLDLAPKTDRSRAVVVVVVSQN